MSDPAVFEKLTDPVNGHLQELWMFFCPGCKCGHLVRVRGDEAKVGPVWQWNGDVVKPTVSPSILACPNQPERRCHSFVRDGLIEFLSDCHHELRGTTVALQPVVKT